MNVAILDIVGLGDMPSTKPGVRKRLNALGITGKSERGRFLFALEDLPEDVRRAFTARELDRLSLDPGTYDAAAHAEFMEAPAGLRARAERDAAVARLLVSLSGESWAERLRLVREQFGDERTSKPSLNRLLKRVAGVDPANYAPALLARYCGGPEGAEFSPEAQAYYLTTIRDGGPDLTAKQAWRDVRDVAAPRGWAWPSYETVMRWWNALPEAQKLTARHGREVACKRLAMPAHRDKTSIRAMDIVSLDGRTVDFWLHAGDGRPRRYTFLVLVDVFSNMILGWELAESENAAATVRLIRRAVAKHGLFRVLYTDNGRAFSGNMVAGGIPFSFRNGGRQRDTLQPIGIATVLGFDVRHAMPGNAQAKIAERIYATLSRSVDDRPEFKGAHAGHAPGASPNESVTPMHVDDALPLIEREVARHNNERGRRSQGARGRSYRQMFEESVAQQVVTWPTERQLYLAALVYKPVAVDRHGQVWIDKWVYGDPTTQAALLPFHGTGRRILLGRDPDDLAAPAVAFDEDGRLITEGIPPIRRGVYESVDGSRRAARNRKAAREHVRQAEEANAYMSAEEFRAALATLDAVHAPSDGGGGAPAKVVGGRFGSPLRETRPSDTPATVSVVPQEYLDNMDAALAAKRRGGESA